MHQSTTAPGEREPGEHEHHCGLRGGRVDAVASKSDSDRLFGLGCREREQHMLTPDVSVSESLCACDRAFENLVECVETARGRPRIVCGFARQFVYVDAQLSEDLASEVTFGGQP